MIYLVTSFFISSFRKSIGYKRKEGYCMVRKEVDIYEKSSSYRCARI